MSFVLGLEGGSQVALPIGWASIIAMAIPPLTALVTRYRSDRKVVHALVAMVAAGLVAVIQMLTDDVPNDTVTSIIAAFLGVFVPMLASYLGFWKPIVEVNQRLVPDKGLAEPDAPPPIRQSPKP